jgi:hypothetical protein
MLAVTRRLVPVVAAAVIAAFALAWAVISSGPSATVYAASSGAAEDATDAIQVTLSNPVVAPRQSETIALDRSALDKLSPGFDLKKAVVVDAAGDAVLSQLVAMNADEVPDQLVFQTDFGPNETKTFTLRIGQRRPATRTDFKVYGRFVRERNDDFAWENDLIAHRMYGPDLETWKQEPLTSSGVDVWVKRVSKLVVNDWYMMDDYHQDHGEGADFYSVGKSRGCGGLGTWVDETLRVSRNFTTSRVLANGPIRLVFELDYAAWEVAGVRVAETKRVILDAGSQFDRFESTFTGAPRGLLIGIGIAKHPGGSSQMNESSDSMLTWEPLQGGKSGNLGCAVVLPPGSGAVAKQTDSDHLLVTPVPASGPLRYYAGFAWDRGGRIADLAGWAKEVQGLSHRLAAPIKPSLTRIAGVKAGTTQRN